MSGLVRLYPRAWRERYGDELAILVGERPTSPLDQLDLIRGALDAYLHPELAGGHISEGTYLDRRLPAIAALGAGIIWIAYAAIGALVSSDWATFGPTLAGAGQLAGWISVVLMFVAAIGTHLQPYSTRIISWGLGIGFIWLVAAATPWPSGVFLLFAVLGVIAATLLFLTGFRAGLSWGTTAVVIAFGAVLPVVLVFLELGAPSSTFAVAGWDPTIPVLIAPLGAAWLLLGLLMLGRYMPASRLAANFMSVVR